VPIGSGGIYLALPSPVQIGQTLPAHSQKRRILRANIPTGPVIRLYTNHISRTQSALAPFDLKDLGPEEDLGSALGTADQLDIPDDYLQHFLGLGL
jgi:hypothetical protein